MPRRIHTPHLQSGDLELPPAQARHLRTVLRLQSGETVEAFDNAGATAQAVITQITPQKVVLHIESITPPPQAAFAWTIAAALPKGPRADWMIEKLAELGTARFVPLITERSVTIPGGAEKIARWTRLSEQASRQSGRPGVMQISPLTHASEFVKHAGQAWFLSTDKDAVPILNLSHSPPPASLTLFIGPEGGWTDQEIAAFRSAGLTGVKLAESILRVETAAVAAAAMAAAWQK